MIRLLLVLIAVATAFGAEKTDAPSKGVLLLNFKDPPAINIFDTPTSFQNFKIIENIIFLNEAEECRSKYPTINQTTFYEHLYCSLQDEEYSTSTGIFCVMTKPLIKKIQKRLNDFIVFRNLSKMKEFCLENNSRSKRNSLDSDLLPGVELMREDPKEKDRNYVYLGPSRFPMTTELHNRLSRIKKNGSITMKGAAARALTSKDQLAAGKEKFAVNKQIPATDYNQRGEGNEKTKQKRNDSSKPRTKYSSKSRLNHKFANKKIHKAPRKSAFQLFKFRMLKEADHEDDYINEKMLENLYELNDSFHKVEGNSFLYFKLFETLLNIFERFNQHMEKEKIKELQEKEVEVTDDLKEEYTEDEKEEEEKQMDGDEKVGTEEEEDSVNPQIFTTTENNYKMKAPELLYTSSWD